MILSCTTMADAQEHAIQYVQSGSATIAYHVDGADGDIPLLLINGGPGFDHQYFHLTDVWQRFAQARRVVFFDQRGTGASTGVGPTDQVTADDILQDIDAIRAALRVPRLVVLGHSWGGWLAMAYALRYPERVERIVLVGSAAPYYADTEFLLEPLFPDSLARGASWRFYDPQALQADIKRHVAMSFYSPELRKRVVGGIEDLPLNVRQAVLLQRSANEHDLGPELGRIAVPVLVGTGRFDANVAPRGAWKIHERIAGSRFVVWERSGHYPFIEEPDAFFEAVSAFLADGR